MTSDAANLDVAPISVAVQRKARLTELATAINSSPRVRRNGGEAAVVEQSVVLNKNGARFGAWTINDTWFEYNGRMPGAEPLQRAAWMECAISMTNTILER